MLYPAVVDLKITTWNVKYDAEYEQPWSQRRSTFFTILNQIKPDVLCVQEALTHQVRDIAESLGKSWVGVGREDGIADGEYCAIFYPSNWNLVNSGTFWLSEEPEKPASMSWDTACTRICTWADFGDICIANTHLDHISSQAQIEGVKLILERLDGNIDVLAGDFNAWLTDSCFDALDGSQSFADWAQHHDRSSRGPDSFQDFGRTGGYGQIDHIFVGNRWKPERQTILAANFGGQYASDHNPVTRSIS